MGKMMRFREMPLGAPPALLWEPQPPPEGTAKSEALGGTSGLSVLCVPYYPWFASSSARGTQKQHARLSQNISGMLLVSLAHRH